MVSVRLAVVLALYAVLVAAALITITVVFSVLSKNAMNELVVSLAKSSMSDLQQATMDEITSYETTTYHIAMLLERLNLTPPMGTTGQDINDYVTTWDVMTVPDMHADSTFLSTFGLWLDTDTDLWYMTGCNRQTELCTLYDAAANTTQYVAYHRTLIANSVNTSTVTTEAGTPPLYQRYADSLSLHTNLNDPSWWSYLYIDYAQSVTTHTCNGVAVAKTIDYFYCTDYYTPTGSSTPACKQLVGVTVEATEAGTSDQTEFITASTVYLASTRTIDNVDGLCDPDAGISKAIDNYIAICGTTSLNDCGVHSQIGKPYVYTVLGYSQTNGVAFVIASQAPHSFFFATIDHSQDVAISISTVMIVVVVILSVIICISIVVPISYICASMKNASNLTYERHMPSLTRYTVFSEVQQLCASYLDLRQALKDLKAFMPQGLLVGPEEGMESNSLLSALMGNGQHSGGGDDDDEDSEDDEDDRDASGAGGDVEMGGRGGGYSTPEVTTSGDTFIQPIDVTRRQSVSAPPAFFPSPDGDLEEHAPLPNQRRRSAIHGGGNSVFRGQNGIVSVVAVSTVDEALARDAALAARPGSRPSRRPSQIASAAVPSSKSPCHPPQRQTSSHVRMAGTADSSMDRRVRFRNGCSTLNGDSSRGEGASLRLNRSVYNGDINKIRSVNCTLVCIRFSFQFIDEHSLEGEVSHLMNILIRVILRYGGVVEIFRPDFIAVSFGAHAVMSLHTQRATAAAITIMKKLTVAQRSRTRMVVDTGAFYCGTCGANGRVSPVLFGERFDSTFELLRYDLGLGRLVVTDRVALCLPADFVVPIDYLVTLRDRSHGCQLFLVVNPAKKNKKEFRESVNAFRQAYALAISGRYRDALEIVNRGGHFDIELASYYAATFKYLLSMNPPRPRYCRFQLPGFEPLGVTVKEKAPRYQHDHLHLGELEPEDETPVSINFGFGGFGSSMNTTANANGGGGNNGSQSHVFVEEVSSPHLDSLHSENNNNNNNQSRSANRNNISVEAYQSKNDATGTHSALPRRRSRPANTDHNTLTATVVRSFATTDDLVTSATEKIPLTASWSRAQNSRRRDCTSSISRAGDTGRSDVSEDGLPLVFTDHKGERWHRFPDMIGSGAFAEVYKAISENGSLMALKCIHLAATNVQLADVVVEVNTACKLFSDFIVNHIGWAHVGSYMIIIMDYMSGGSLHSALAAFPCGMTLQVGRRYASDSLHGLAYLHRNGVVHADFKPQNILLASDGGCRISDFGSSVTKTNARSSGGDVFHLRGTPAYMSPEVAKGDPPSMKSDMWSFGITLYEMLTGHLPWKMKKSTGVPAAPTGSFFTGVQTPSTIPAPATETAAAAAAVESTTENVMHDVYDVRPGDALMGSATDILFTNGTTTTTTTNNNNMNSAKKSTTDSLVVAAAPLPSSAVEWVPVHGLSDARFVQGIANGSLQVQIEPAELPTTAAYELIAACLHESPSQRPISWEMVDHPFFFTD